MAQVALSRVMPFGNFSLIVASHTIGKPGMVKDERVPVAGVRVTVGAQTGVMLWRVVYQVA